MNTRSARYRPRRKELNMLELKDIFGNTVQIAPDMETAMETAEIMPQIVDIHDQVTGDTWSRAISQTGLSSWVWHWENW